MKPTNHLDVGKPSVAGRKVTWWSGTVAPWLVVSHDRHPFLDRGSATSIVANRSAASPANRILGQTTASTWKQNSWSGSPDQSAWTGSRRSWASQQGTSTIPAQCHPPAPRARAAEKLWRSGPDRAPVESPLRRPSFRFSRYDPHASGAGALIREPQPRLRRAILYSRRPGSWAGRSHRFSWRPKWGRQNPPCAPDHGAEQPDEGTCPTGGSTTWWPAISSRTRAEPWILGQNGIDPCSRPCRIGPRPSVRSLLGSFFSATTRVIQGGRDLSGGEKGTARPGLMASLPCILRCSIEPTNHLDIPAKTDAQAPLL